MGLKEWKDKLFPNTVNYDEDALLEEEEELGYEREPVGVRETLKQDGYRPETQGVSMASRSSIEMKVVSPTKYDAVTQIADLLLEKKTVLLNLENTNKETAKRLIDFLSGVAYALNGDIQKVADNTFAVTPNNVAVSNEIIDSEFSAGVSEDQFE